MHPGRGFPGKRKRGDRNSSLDEGSTRPSPHRPGNAQLAQQGREQEHRHRQNSYPGSRRHSRGGRGGYSQRFDGANSGQTLAAGSGPSNPRPNVAASPSHTAAPLAPLETDQVEPPPQPSQPSQPPQPSQLPQQFSFEMPMSTVTPPTVVPDPRPYLYEQITDDLIGTWNDSGRATVQGAGVEARFDEDAIALGTLFQELLRSALSGRLDATEAGKLVKDLLELPPGSDGTEPMDQSVSGPPFDAQLLFLDCLSVITENDAPESLRTFLISTGVQPGLLRRHLEVPLLESLGLIRSTFNRMGIRKTTNLLYRQSNYNLLREESEGYSKLMTELFTTSNNEPPSGETVDATFERVKALVGAFDLDVGRVLDVVLDVFASVLVKQNRFYVKFLRTSSWWPKEGQLQKIARSDDDHSLPSWALPGAPHWQTDDDQKQALKELKKKRDCATWERVSQVGARAFFEVGRQRVSPDQLPQVINEDGDNVTAEAKSYMDWIKTTGTLPARGNRVAAQLLGFKLRFYASPARDATDVLPINIIYLAALLIKIGFISLEDLYPHLYPPDEKMPALKEEKMKEKAEKERLNRPGGGAANALMMAGALPDDTAPPPPRGRDHDASRAAAASKLENNADKAGPSAAEEKDKLPEPSCQKVLLLKSLLCIGALPESLFILGRFPWLPDAFPDILPYIHRILHFSIGKVYDGLRPLSERESVRQAKRASELDSSTAAKGQLRFLDAVPRKVLRWALPDKDDDGDGVDYRFYWDDWADNVPLCRSVDDVFLLCRTLGAFSGLKIGTNPALLVSLVRIGKQSLAEDASAPNQKRWADLCKRLLVPALSLTIRNPGVVNEVWELIKTFPTATRYSIYAEWYSGATSRLPDIKSAFEQTKAETKDVLKRISKTNIKPMARALAKVAYSSPGVVFSVAIGQIEAYDNLVEVVVECARYFTYLGYDVLTWSLMNALGGRGRNRVQSDGMLTSKWLAALSLFAGRTFKRYSQLMNPAPILQYVAHQLSKGNTVDLIVLRELITSMAGIISDTNFNDSQILAMAGGPLLRQQTLYQLLDKRHESRTTAKRFMRALIEPSLAAQLLILIAQERQTIIYKVDESQAHVKILGNLADEVHRVLTQYLDLLRSNLSPSEFGNVVPDVISLISEFGIDPNVAFWLSRPSITAEIHEYDLKTAKESDQQATRVPAAADGSPSKESAGDAKTAQPSPSTEEKGDGPQGDVSAVVGMTNGDSEMQDVSVASVAPTAVASSEAKSQPEPWHPVLSSLMGRAQAALPRDTFASLSPAFYVTFWQLSLYDVQVPTKTYEEELTRLQNRWMAVRDDRSDMGAAGTIRKEKERKQLAETQDRLRDELKAHIQAFSRTKARLYKEKDHWFAAFWTRWVELNDALITYCLVPRLMVSPADALYCFKMIKLLHTGGAVNFRTMVLMDRIFRESRIANLIFLCSAREAENLGRFVNELLKDLSRWHADKSIFEKEAYGPKKDLPGFAVKLVKEKATGTLLPFEDFRRLVYKWHRQINSALKACLSSGEYMHIRNAIIILKAIHQYFPVVNWIGRDQVLAVTDLSKNEKREDLKIAATSLLGNLKRREKQWMPPQAFNLIEQVANSAANPASGPARTTTPKPHQNQESALNATGHTNKPKAESNAHGPGDPTKESRKHDVEDGEIDDGRAKRARLMEQNPKLAETLQAVSRTPRPPLTEGPAAKGNPMASNIPNQARHLPNRATNPNLAENRAQNMEFRNGHQSHPPQALQNLPLASTNPARPDFTRQISSGPMASQVPHSLPKRPELPTSLGRNQERRPQPRPGPAERAPVRETDEAVGPVTDYGRLERPSEHAKDPADRRLNATPALNRVPPRGQDRAVAVEEVQREYRRPELEDAQQLVAADGRYVRPTPRDVRGSVNGERREDHIHEAASHMRLPDGALAARDSLMAPPRGISAAKSERPVISSEMDRRDGPGPGLGPERGEWRGSPQQISPAARDERRPAGPEGRLAGRREDQAFIEDRRPSAEHDLKRGRADPIHAPTGPRGDRMGQRMTQPDMYTPSYDRPREPGPGHMPQATHANDADQARLGHDQGVPPRPQDPNYGRLNHSPASDIPSGPRRNAGPGRAHRSVTAPQPALGAARPVDTDNRAYVPTQQPTQQPTQERQPPTGPSSVRGGHRSGSTQFEHPFSAHSSAPPTPVSESGPGLAPTNLAGVHPERLSQLAGAMPANEAPQPAPASQALSQQHTAPPIGPSGPRGPQQPPQSPVGLPPSAVRNLPAGPNAPMDRGRDKRFAGLQNMLQSGAATTPDRMDRGGAGVSIRGRGGRSNGMSPPSPGSGRPTPDSARAELGFARANGMIGTPEQEEGRDRGETRRSGRYQPSRSQGHEQEQGGRRGGEFDRMAARDEHRDRRSGAAGAGAGGRDERESRRLRGEEGGRDRERREPREGRVDQGRVDQGREDNGGTVRGGGRGQWSATTMAGGGGAASSGNERNMSTNEGPASGGGGGRERGERNRGRDRDRDHDRDRGGENSSRRESRKRPRGVGGGGGGGGAATTTRDDEFVNNGGGGGGGGGNGGGDGTVSGGGSHHHHHHGHHGHHHGHHHNKRQRRNM